MEFEISGRSRYAGIFAFSRTKGDSIHWPAKYFASIAVKREKNPGAATFHRRLNSCLQIAQSHLDIFTARNYSCASDSSRFSLYAGQKMQTSVLLSLLLAASIHGRPTGSEIAQVSFSKKKLQKKIFHLGVKKTGSLRLKRT